MITEYKNSKGQILQISEMNFVYLQNAINKLKKDLGNPNESELRETIIKSELSNHEYYQFELLDALNKEYCSRPEYVPNPEKIPQFKSSNAVPTFEKPQNHSDKNEPLNDDF